MNPSDFQSGKTQAIDLDELNVEASNRPREQHPRNEFDLDAWDANPWSEDARNPGRRGWAQDDRWAGDDEPKNNVPGAKPDAMWDVDDPSKNNGWNAPARGDVLQGTSEGWEDWGSNSDGGPLKDDGYGATKEEGGYVRQQAANNYLSKDTSNYNDGRAIRNDIYKSKESVDGGGWGTAGLQERRGDYHSRAPEPSMEAAPPMDNMVMQGGWGDEDPFAAGNNNNMPMASAAPADGFDAAGGSGDEIPGPTKASLVIFPQGGQPVVVPLKLKMTTIGRALDNTIVLNDPYASRKHALITFNAGQFEFMTSRPDIKANINGYAVLHVSLVSGDIIEIGQTSIRYVFGAVSPADMQPGAPVNGEPHHIGEPPAGSGAKDNKMLVRIIAGAISAIVVLIIVMIIVLATSGGKDEGKEPVASNEPAETTEEPESDKPEVPDFDLTQNDRDLAKSLVGIAGLIAHPESLSEIASPVEKIEISINSNPQGATIINPDGTVRGTTPYKIKETISSGNQKWTLKLEDYEDKLIEVSLADNIEVSEDLVSTRPTKTATVTPRPPAPPRDCTGKPCKSCNGKGCIKSATTTSSAKNCTGKPCRICNGKGCKKAGGPI